MSRNLMSKAVAATIIGVVWGWRIHHGFVRWNHLGKDAFLANQAHRFDQSMAAPHPAGFTIFVMVILLFILFGVYELIALGVSKLFKAPSSPTA